MNRGDCLRIAAAGWVGTLGARAVFARPPSAEGRVMTVLGPISPGQLGRTLPHEHVRVDFVGADTVSRDRYDANEAYAVAIPCLCKARSVGCQALAECTPAYLGQDPQLLSRLATATGLHILTNTGYYGAAKDRCVPRHACEESADQLASRWVKQWTNGIEGTGIRPGFVKTGVDVGRFRRSTENTDDETVPVCVERVAALKQRGCLSRLLVSHDAGWYRSGEPGGGACRGFETVYTVFVPSLRKAGWSEDQVCQLLDANPAAAFTVRGQTRV